MRGHALRTALTIFLLLAACAPAAGQLVDIVRQPGPPANLPLQYNLWKAERFASERSLSIEELKSELESRGLVVEDGLVHVEIVGPRGSEAVTHEFVETFGGVGDTRWGHRLDAWIPVGELTNVARAVPVGHRVVRADPGAPDDVFGEGPAAINSISYRNNGAFGQGRIVGIIDGGFSGASAAEANGDLDGYGYVNYAYGGIEDGGTHGTGCAEAVFDHCPGAVMWLYRTDSVADTYSAVEHAIENDVDVLTHSLSRYNMGWEDNSGDACDAANMAGDAGILFFTSAGNRAEMHWQGMFNPGAGDVDTHDWVHGDETIDMLVQDGAQLMCTLAWDNSGESHNYDLFLYDSSFDLLDDSASLGPFYEEFTWENDTGGDVLVHLVVGEGSDSSPGEFEVFVHNFDGWCDWQEHEVPVGSTTSPSNSVNSRVVSVGAVEWGDFGSLSGATGINMPYSGQGPSNNGMILPEIAGPTNTTGFTYPGGFGGTSCATPNVAGAAVAFWSADPALAAYPIWWLMANQAVIRRDWGDEGADNIYGNGGAHLLDYVPNTIWVARDYGNVVGYRFAPLYTMEQAEFWAAPGGRILAFPGGNYPEPVTLTKQLTVESVENSAILGE